MARDECTFRQRDLTAAIKAAKAAGCEVQRFEIDKTGRIVVVTAAPQSIKPPSPTTAEPERNEWDDA